LSLGCEAEVRRGGTVAQPIARVLVVLIQLPYGPVVVGEGKGTSLLRDRMVGAGDIAFGKLKAFVTEATAIKACLTAG
jgi:hypothetical protein